MFDFAKTLAMAQQLLDAIKLLSAITQANTEATEKHAALLQQTAYSGNITKSPDSETRAV